MGLAADSSVLTWFGGEGIPLPAAIGDVLLTSTFL
jgi:hypothetical protein